MASVLTQHTGTDTFRGRTLTTRKEQRLTANRPNIMGTETNPTRQTRRYDKQQNTDNDSLQPGDLSRCERLTFVERKKAPNRPWQRGGQRHSGGGRHILSVRGGVMPRCNKASDSLQTFERTTTTVDGTDIDIT